MQTLAQMLDDKAQMLRIKDLFRRIDKDKSGSVSQSEFLAAITTFWRKTAFDNMFAETAIIEVFHRCDLDHGGEIEYEEFLVMIRRGRELNEKSEDVAVAQEEEEEEEEEKEDKLGARIPRQVMCCTWILVCIDR